MGRGEHLKMLPFPSGTALSGRSVALFPKPHFPGLCVAFLMKCNHDFPVAATLTKWIMSFPAVLEAGDWQL